MRLTTTAILTGLMLGGTAYAQQAPAPARPPIAIPAPAATPAQTTAQAPATSPAPATPDRPAAAVSSMTVGDVVELRSGSPHMTIIEMGADVQVLWYSADKGLQRERFPAAALEKILPSEPDEYAPAQPKREERPMSRTRGGEEMDRYSRYEGRDRDRRRYYDHHDDHDDDRYDRYDRGSSYRDDRR